ncbi:MAG TPA: glycosyltransferase family 39 protein [Bryobacteraceae bacterium]|nr:glycosyltransferase family 39 protein [Bryobacteraceae bacterium]
MEATTDSPKTPERLAWRGSLLILLLVAAATYLICISSPPSLMDDVDAVQAQIPRNMLISGDWVTARLDGVIYLEKSPLMYWLIAISYEIFGIHDWAARIPIALSTIALAWLTALFGNWAFGEKAGFYAGLCMATCVGLFLFTRILIPDVMLTFTIALAMWAFLRVLDDEEPHPRLWAYLFAACLGVSLLLKSLIGVVFPLATAAVYLTITRKVFSWSTWKRFHLPGGTAILLLIALPWHVLATLRNPPYFAFTLHSGPGQYHGFLWFYFINEQLLRFLNLRYPPDYSTVPRVYFWLFQLVWLFPWSVYFPAAARLSYKPADRAGRVRLLALCWVGFILVFFTFSSTQEYYSMPCYPALALLLGSGMAAGGKWIRWGTRALTAVAAVCAAACLAILIAIRNVPAPGDISAALAHQATYKLSLGHMQDLTLHSFAYLRIPLALAAIAFLAGVVGTIRASFRRAFLAAAIMMVLFYQAARLALVAFDPYLSSRPLANAILASPPGRIIVDTQYWLLSSIPYYTNRSELMLNGRWFNLEYGSNAPGAPNVFINDSDFQRLWLTPQRFYIVAKDAKASHLEHLVGSSHLHVVAQSGGKRVYTNLSLAAAGGDTADRR